MDKCPKYWKMGTQMLVWKKREMNKIAPILSQRYFQVSRERYVFKEQSRIRLATTYIHLIYPHTCTSWFDCMTHFSLDLRFDFTIYALQVCSSFLSTYELQISLSDRKRKCITSLLPWWGSTNTAYIERLESVIQWNLEFYFKNL
jgi:hypothetical protein